MGNEHDDDVTPLEIPAVRAGCEISRRNARDFVAKAPVAELIAWKHCGCDGCVFCDEVSRVRETRIPPPANHAAVATTDGRPADQVRAEQRADPAEGQHRSYLVLSEDERRRGFVRAVRQSYKHVGTRGPLYPLRDLTPDEQVQHAGCGYVKFEPYPASMSPVAGMFWTQAKLDAIGKGCGTITTMGIAIAESYSRSPTFYSATFCTGCNRHLPVGAHGEFVWLERGHETTERVGT